MCKGLSLQQSTLIESVKSGSRILRGFEAKRRAPARLLLCGVVRFLGCLGHRLDVPELGEKRVLIVVAPA